MKEHRANDQNYRGKEKERGILRLAMAMKFYRFDETVAKKLSMEHQCLLFKYREKFYDFL